MLIIIRFIAFISTLVSKLAQKNLLFNAIIFANKAAFLTHTLSVNKLGAQNSTPSFERR